MSKARLTHQIVINVRVPYGVKAESVENAINERLDEVSGDYWDPEWFVDAARVVKSRIGRGPWLKGPKRS